MKKNYFIQIRQQIDLPIKKRKWNINILLPILLFISIIWSLIAYVKRQKSYLKTNKNYPKTIAIGNILVGGTGKSPIVRKLASTYLQQGYIVFIVNKAYTKNHKLSVYINTITQNINETLFSDESLEHLFLLKEEFPNHLFYIIDGKDRFNGIISCYALLTNEQQTRTICLLDDALQSFYLPRTFNYVVTNPYLLKETPLFCLPLGPWREGFLISFNNLYTSFDLRFWSRIENYQNINDYKNIISLALQRIGLKFNAYDIIVIEKITFLDISNKIILNNDLLLEIILSNNYYFCLGIAQPHKVCETIANMFKINKDILIFHLLEIKDHGNLSTTILKILNKNEKKYLFITYKDYFRWRQSKEFILLEQYYIIIIIKLTIEFK